MSLLPRISIVLGVGVVVLGGASLFHRRNDDARFAEAAHRADAACRSYRSVPGHEHAAACREWDAYAPRALDKYKSEERHIEQARTALRPADAERQIRSALALAEEMAPQGTIIGELTAASIVRQTLDLLDERPDLDARALLRDVRLDGARRPFEAERIHHGWLVIERKKAGESAGAVADAFERSETAWRAMEAALIERRDVDSCNAIAVDSGPEIVGVAVATELCAKMAAVVETGARLDRARAAHAARVR